MSSMGSLELIKETELTERQTELVDNIISSTNAQLMLIEDIMQVVKIEFENSQANSDKIHRREKFHLGTTLQSLKNVVVGYAQQFSVSIEFQIDQAVESVTVESNQSRLYQIISNLITNAVKASKSGDKVTFTCTYMGKKNEEEWFSFKVMDYGCGIPKSKIESIFEPFVQLYNNQSNIPRYVTSHM